MNTMNTFKRITIIILGLLLSLIGICGMQMAESAEFLQPYIVFKMAFAIYGLLLAILGFGLVTLPGILYIEESSRV